MKKFLLSFCKSSLVLSTTLLFSAAYGHGTIGLDVCKNEEEKNSHGFNICQTSELNKEGLLHFHAEVSMSTSEAVICSDSSDALIEAELWMPSMGHGSAPTKLTALKNNCWRVQDMEFFMPGDWEVRAKFESKDQINFAIEVPK